MTDHRQEVLDALRLELRFLDKGGYEPSLGEPQKEFFRDSPSCPNFGSSGNGRPCSECWLMDFVPADKRGEAIPCHHIPLNARRDTVAAMMERGETVGAQEAMRDWLHRKLEEMEATMQRCDL